MGHVISARAAISRTDDHWVAYAGTHGGRLAGVVVDGPQAGSVMMDIQLGGIVWSSPMADATGRVLVGTDDDRLTAIVPATGEIAWSTVLGDCQGTRVWGPEGTRCDVDGGPTLGWTGDLFVGAAGLVRMTARGRVVWSFPPAPAVAPHVFSTPALTADTIYFGAQDGTMYAIDHEGRARWSVALGPDVDSSPAIGPDGTIYVGADDGRVRAFGPDGRLRWEVRAGRDIRSAIAVDQEGGIYATSLDGSVYALAPEGSIQWVFPTGGPIHASPVIDTRGNLFVGSTDHWLYAIARSGKLLWKYELPADVDASVALSPMGHAVVGCDDGVLRAFR